MDDSIDVLFVCVLVVCKGIEVRMYSYGFDVKRNGCCLRKMCMFLRKWTMYDYSILCSHTEMPKGKHIFFLVF